MSRWSLVVRFLGEWLKWNLFGRPIRDQQEMDYCFRICYECKEFDKYEKEGGICSICGCNIHRTKKHINKLYWRTTHCPLKKWS